MLIEPASVVSHDGPDLRLHTSRKTTCSGCSLKSGCGQYLLLRHDDEFSLHDCLPAHDRPLVPGERVQLELGEGRLLQLTVLLYGLPLLMLLLATLAAAALGAAEKQAMLAALAGLLGGALLSHWLLGRKHIRLRLTPRVRLSSTQALAADRRVV